MTEAVHHICRLNTKTQAIRSVAELKHRGFTVAPGIEWKSGAKGVAVSHKFSSGTLKGSYAVDSKVAGLEYDFKPFKVSHCCPVDNSVHVP